MTLIKKEFQWGDNKVSIETGEIARQADGAVMVNMDDTVVQVTVVEAKSAVPRDFFPLTVDYQEKTYAAGMIPGGFFRREGRPSEKEILTARLIDRPIRPLFPKGFTSEVQVIITVMSLNPDVDPEIPSLIGTSAALAISGLPFQGPVGAARVSYKDGEYTLNSPSTGLSDKSDLDLVVAGTEEAVLMVESEANQLSEEVMLGAVLFGHENFQVVIQAIKELAAEVNKPIEEFTPPVVDEELKAAVAAEAAEGIGNAYRVADKLDRYAAIDATVDATLEKLTAVEVDGEQRWSKDEIYGQLEKLKKVTVRGRILDGEPRIDGRDTRTVRPIA
ncbi:MAG: polyribonucleotide nucleotidyltransferase, partial [Candidatus Thiodiazotropha taylori]